MPASLTDRQRLICLLTSVGELEECIAKLLEIGLRTVETEKQLIATRLGLPTRLLVIWAVEHRNALRSEIKDWESVSDRVRALVAPGGPSEWDCDYCI